MSLAGWLACAAALAVSGFAHTASAAASVMDEVAIARRGEEATIRIGFAVPVRYRGHAPAGFGKVVRIHAELELEAGEDRPAQAVLRLPETDMVPRLSVTYPDSQGAVLVEFDHPTQFSVAAGADGRSIRLTVPALLGAKDLLLASKEWVPTKRASASAGPAAATQARLAAPTAGGMPIVGYAGGGNGAYLIPVNSLKQARFATVVRQEQDWSCGSAAVATLLTYHYGYPISEREALDAMFEKGDQARIRTEGFSLLDIKLFLESLGFRANGFEVGLDRLAEVGVPAIVAINDSGYNHFVVVKGLRDGNVLLGDSVKGTRVVARSEFETMWISRIVFVITSRSDGVAFNAPQDWRYMAARLGDAVSRESLAGMLLFRPGVNDF